MSSESLFDVKMAWGVPTLRGPAPANRWGHSSTIVDKKQMYVIGGHDLKDNSKVLGDLAVLNTATFEWSIISATGVPPAPRDSHTALAFDGSIFVFGGGNGKQSFADGHMLDTETHTWSPIELTGTIPALEGHTNTLVHDAPYIYGGCCSNEQGTSYNREVYEMKLEHNADTEPQSWRCQFEQVQIQGDVKPPVRDSHTANSYQDALYIFGGDGEKGYQNDLWKLSTAVDSWEQITEVSGKPPCPRGGHASHIIKGKLLVFGGSASDQSRLCFNDMHIFDIEANAWSMARLVGNAPCARFCHTLVGCKDESQLICYGGCEDQPASAGDYFNGPVLVLNNELAADSTIAADWGPGVHFDPCTPQTSLDCFNNFMKSELIRVKNEHRDISHNEALKLVGQRWAQHPDNPKCILTSRESEEQENEDELAAEAMASARLPLAIGTQFVGSVVSSFEHGYTISVSINGDPYAYRGLILNDETSGRDDSGPTRAKRKYVKSGLYRKESKEMRMDSNHRWAGSNFNQGRHAGVHVAHPGNGMPQQGFYIDGSPQQPHANQSVWTSPRPAQ